MPAHCTPYPSEPGARILQSSRWIACIVKTAFKPATLHFLGNRSNGNRGSNNFNNGANSKRGRDYVNSSNPDK
ncbi:hypothetical protein OUZ56_012818 [Daphnia magna]|uniref:Uncharacterized protein n=1 Tax=Daphnia magna TaxID=35525 RepID=A0ABQ9Z450_9CRUS|nr:hypothetical protein OUZ56_012818 [Daphnia magna]